MTSAADWSGRVGVTWADEWRRTDRAFAGIARVLDAAILAVAPDVGCAVDIGCGAGGTSLALALARPGLQVTGVDLSDALVAIARQRGEGVANLRFAVGDVAEALPPDASIDLLVSRHGVMFLADPVAGFTRLRATARPDARLVFSCVRDRDENDWARIVDAALGVAPAPAPHYSPGPFGLADRAFTADMLDRSGWTGSDMAAIDVDYVVGQGDDPVGEALSFFARIGPAAAVLAAAQPDRRAAIVKALREALEARREGDHVTLRAAAWIWTASAGEPA